jgi:hypothetical protein
MTRWILRTFALSSLGFLVAVYFCGAFVAWRWDWVPNIADLSWIDRLFLLIGGGGMLFMAWWLSFGLQFLIRSRS